MSNEVRIDEEKRLAQLKKTNPLFGDTPLKLGTFLQQRERRCVDVESRRHAGPDMGQHVPSREADR